MRNLGLIFNSAFKLDQLLVKVKAYLLPDDFERVIHNFVTTHLDYFNYLYVGHDQSLLHCLQVVQMA